jgi:hypothetical protein
VSDIGRTAKILKAGGDSAAKKQILYCVVAEPDVEDLQGDILTADEIEKMAHLYLAEHRLVGDSHETVAKAAPVESFIAPMDLVVEGEQIKKGSWVIAIKVYESELWSAVEKGEYNGVSIGGTGVRTPVPEKTA